MKFIDDLFDKACEHVVDNIELIMFDDVLDLDLRMEFMWLPLRLKKREWSAMWFYAKNKKILKKYARHDDL